MKRRLKEILGLIIAVLLVLGSLQGFAQEDCNNGIDDDGDGLIDCTDDDCQYPLNIERGCNCKDGDDNDGDGYIDISDPDCASFYGLTFV